MPAKAPTPRTTRNSRGLRQSPGVSSADSCLGDSARVSRRRGNRGTPPTTNFELALEAAADPATPTPGARFAEPNPHPAHTLALEAIPEEQSQPTTPTPTARPPVFPPPISLPPTTPYIPTSPPRTSPLEHPRVTAIRSTPTRTPRRAASPRTPVRRTRYVTRYIDVTPLQPTAPAPKSPGSETRLFKQRRNEEGEEKFARELWIAIRNDRYMKECWCGPPNIYNSREEAEVATGHLRFYIVGSEEKNLRVLQKKDDSNWHCICGNNNYHAVYKNFLNSNGKRPAEDTEIGLIAQIQDSNSDKSARSIERVVPAPIDSTRHEEEHSLVLKTAQAEAQTFPQSMWGKACGILSRTVATMSSPIAAIYDTLQKHFCGDAYETLDTRRKDADSEAVVVKRLKQQAPVLPTEQSPSENGDDGFDDLVWPDLPTDHIGSEEIQDIFYFIGNQFQDVKTGKLVYGSSVADIKKQAPDTTDCRASIAIFKYQELRHGPVLPGEPAIKKKEKWMETVQAYHDSLKECLRLIQEIYCVGGILEGLKKRYTAPPRRLPLRDIHYRREALLTAKFLGFLRSLDIVRDISDSSYETISKMIVDVNAIHKSEMLPSFVALRPEDPIENMPGFFPEDKVSAMEEIPADEFECEVLYERRFPDPEPSGEEVPSRPGDYKMVLEPKGILKPSKVRDAPASPKYVATPEKHRKLSFINPVSLFIPPAHIPTKVMAPHEADRFLKAKLEAEVLRDEHSTRVFDALKTVSRPQNDGPIRPKDKWSLEELEKDDQEMGLTYYAHKYDGFLNDLRDDLEKRVEADEEERTKRTVRLAPQRHMVQISLPPLPSTPARRRQAAHLLENDTGSPAGSSPGTNPLRTKTEVSQPKPAEQKRPLTLDEFFAEDDDDLAISVAKFEQLQIDRQIRDEFEIGIRRDAEEKRKREEEEARRQEQRRLEEERRRQEEERRREQEAQRQREAEEFAALTGLRQPTRSLIVPLSDDWNCKVVNAARAHPTAELVKTLEGQPLTRRDFEEKLLPPTAWLNDNVIIGSILHVADYINKTNGTTDQEPKCAAFTSYFWPRVLSHGPSACGRLLRRAGVRKANFLDIDTVLIPICAHSHWTLAVIRPGKRTVAHIDSMRGGSGHSDVKAKLLELVAFILEDQFVEADWRAIDYEAPLQTNGWDCGVFTITNAMCMAMGLNPKFSYTESELTLQRRRLAAMLLNEGFKGEFSLDGF
ncbi:hypothetical protein CHGG_10271 [Chaetomium globosum CBS 148.51]|uniref:Ubiquitin-like protease family profile domain-containing protein n=1 Tax=Chaetomium globosum (strain ATCC 6205 / CBS 148.51 / DSM 1962 / NBRC 6347 / NRRL 1970) TaxID=306901 RepID=Q2GP33_CHAGB|nr:uncharacterized protein CHGG_10271 [Chaetomium globosum CBS 148.51]EAQ83867.1 hypothetical protein CHGG_10271 [Chaetomium globosum CBS 148.51]